MVRSAREAARGGIAGIVDRALSIADQPADDDDLLLRKRMGIAAGYLTIVAPLTLPLISQGHPVASAAGLIASAASVFNLWVLSRTQKFERFVLTLITFGAVFVPIIVWFGGGITLTYAGIVYGFLVPSYALLALGPRRARTWFWVFVAIVLITIGLELAFGRPFPPDPFEIQLVGSFINTVLPLAIIFGLLLYSDRRRRAAEARSEQLLTNAIPAGIAQRLKRGEDRIADVYPETTVLFTDLSGFTPWAQKNDATRVAAVLDSLFSRFDRVVADAGLEKIKTIGDSYMAVSGAPEPRTDHASAAMTVARRMLEETAEWREAEDVPLDIRIGLASGPVAGGVIGDRRILFDLWGDTVNAAARMESTSEPGQIQIADTTRALLADDAAYITRQVDVKGLGRMTTYLVSGDGAPRQ
jgi:guanylate cyclase